MGVLGDLFDAAVDKGKDLLSEEAGGLFGGGDESGGLLDRALGEISGGDDSGGGGFLGGLLGGGDDGGGGALGGLLGESGTSALGGLLGESGSSALGGLLGGGDDGGGGALGGLLGGSGDGSWSDTLGGVVDQWTGGDGGLLGGDGLSGITDKVGEFLPSDVTDAAGSILGGEGNWAGSLLEDVSDQIPDEWTSVTDSVLGSGLGEGGFEDWVEQGTDALGSLGVPEGLDDIVPGKQWFGLEPGGIAGTRPTQEGSGGLLFGQTTDAHSGDTGVVPPDLEGSDPADAPVTRHLEGDADDLDLELDVDEGGQATAEPAPTDDLGLDAGDEAASGSSPPMVTDTADIEPGGDDIEMAPAEPPVVAEPAPVEAPEPADEFDQAISAADDIESSTDELFEGLE